MKNNMTNDIANDESNLDLLGVKDDDSEETSIEDKPSKNEEKPESEDSDKSDIIQKIKYREKYQGERSKVAKLEAELSELRSMVKKPSDDAEAKAQEYIRNQAKAVYEELLKEKELQEKKTTQDFEDKIETILEENPDIAEQELLDAIEEYDVEPNIALKILKKTSIKKEKPKMPQARRASPSTDEDKPKPDDTKKTMWQILQEETGKFKKKS
jgi:hypothetical protein